MVSSLQSDLIRVYKRVGKDFSSLYRGFAFIGGLFNRAPTAFLIHSIFFPITSFVVLIRGSLARNQSKKDIQLNRDAS